MTSRLSSLLFFFQLVVANVLEKRKDEVVLVRRESEIVVQVSPDERTANDTDIEQKIVSHIHLLHTEYIH